MNKLSALFKALSDETRLRIVRLLKDGELCVCDIVAALGMVQPKVSFHLNVLKEAGFITDCREGRWIHYRLNESELLRRYLLLSIFDRMPEAAVAGDRKRLVIFLKSKEKKTEGLSLKRSKICCGL